MPCLLRVIALTRGDDGSFSSSMKSKASQRFATILCAMALAGLLTGQGILRDFVLCLGTDGHVALEPATGPGGTCETRSPRETDRELTFQWSLGNRSPGHCGPCEDFILARTSPTYFESSRPQLNRSGNSQVGMPLAAVLHLPAAHGRSIKTLDRFHRLTPRSSSLSALRTTILLI